jgi:hypothetical protein
MFHVLGIPAMALVAGHIIPPATQQPISFLIERHVTLALIFAWVKSFVAAIDTRDGYAGLVLPERRKRRLGTTNAGLKDIRVIVRMLMKVSAFKTTSSKEW